MTQEPVTEVDVVVLGVGPGGEYAANKLASAGLDVVAVDRDLVGGECPFYGCTPSKLMITEANTPEPSFAEAVRRIRDANHDWHDNGHTDRLEAAGVRIVRGHGRLDGPGRVRVGEQVFEARRTVIVNTGTRPAELPIEGLAETPYWTNREVFKITEPPASLVVLGAGPIGAELAQAFARFGTDVTLMEIGPRILLPEEPESSELMTRLLEEQGITVRTCRFVGRVSHDDGRFQLHFDSEVVEADELLVAAGRRNNLDDIGLETVGLDPAATHLEIDERARAGERLHAVGDITGHGAFTHVSIYQAEIIVADLLGEPWPDADYRAVSRVTFTHPEVASVGLTEQQARDAGYAVRTSVSHLERSSRGWIQRAVGLVKVVEDAERGVLVGASVVGPAAGEMIGMFTLAIEAEVPVETFARMHFAYPTLHRAAQVALERLAPQPSAP